MDSNNYNDPFWGEEQGGQGGYGRQRPGASQYDPFSPTVGDYHTALPGNNQVRSAPNQQTLPLGQSAQVQRMLPPRTPFNQWLLPPPPPTPGAQPQLGPMGGHLYQPATLSVDPQLTPPLYITSLEDAGPWVRKHRSIEDGAHAFYEPVRKPVFANDNIDLISSRIEVCVQATYNMMTAKPDNPDDVEKLMYTDFDSKAQQIANVEDVLGNLACLIVKTLLDLHVSGDNLRPDQVQGFDFNHNDHTMTTADRMKTVVAILKRSKIVINELLTGKDKVTLFVAAPEAFETHKKKAFIAQQMARRRSL